MISPFRLFGSSTTLSQVGMNSCGSRRTQPGTHHLFCTQLLGTNHAATTGQVVVMTSQGFQRWLDQNAASGTLAGVQEYAVMALSCTLDPVPTSSANTSPQAVRVGTMAVTLSSPAKRKSHRPL